MTVDQLITEARQMLGESAVITDPAQMATYTLSMRNRHTSPAPMVALPQSAQQVAGIVQLCRKHRVPLVPQGGNTGLVDGGLPRAGQKEIIVNLSRMNRIRDIDTIGMIATAEAGVILQQLHDTLAADDLMFPLWIASQGSAEIGGLISANAGGVTALRYGTMRNLVLGVEAVLPNGEIISTLRALVKDNTGYDLASWFLGAEGTLGIVTAATLRLLPLVRQKKTGVVAVRDVETALDLFSEFRRRANEHLSSFEFMSLNALRLLTKNLPDIRFPADKQDAPYYLLIELSASSENVPLGELFESVIVPALESGKALDAVVAESQTQAQQFWRAREHISPALRVEKQRIHFDLALPLKVLANFLAEASKRILTEYPHAVLIPYGHLGDGNVHYDLYLPNLIEPDAFAAMKKHVQDIVFTEVDRRGGSISAEHGIGVERKAVLARLKSPVELDAMRAIKRAFDPNNLLNPGKIFDV